jgi:hypothetical protein
MRSRRRFGGGVLLSVMLSLLALPPLAGAQSVQLRIAPANGDTLHTRYEQEMEVTGRTRIGAADTTLSMRTTVLLLSRMIVQSSDSSGVTVLAITDSLALLTGGRSGMIPEAQRRAMQGGRIRMRISPVGSASLIDAPPSLAPDLHAALAQMPALLPAQSVRVGSTWTEALEIPIAPGAGAGAAKLHATFRVDSFSRGGELAHISVRGTISRDAPSTQMQNGARMVSSGAMTGRMMFDRRRGWWRESTATITMRTVMHPPQGSTSEPLHFETRIVSRLRTARR